MLEIELKYRVANLDAVRANLRALGANSLGTQHEVDEYFNAPDRNYKTTDEALRIRSSSNTYITYKGPKQPGVIKTRTEIELQIEDYDTARKLFEALRYIPVAIVEKRRELFGIFRGTFDVHVCLDTVTEVGTFVEIEVVCDAANADAARDTVQALAKALGLSELVARSYLGLLLESRERS